MRAVLQLKKRRFDNLLELCTEEIERRDVPVTSTSYAPEARLLRASLLLLRGECDQAMSDFDQLLNMKDLAPKVSQSYLTLKLNYFIITVFQDLDVACVLFQVRCNALIKRGSLRMQSADTTGAMNDFATAARENPNNSDIYHHRGQVLQASVT